MGRIKEVSAETKQAIKKKSAYILPNNPSAAGWKPNEIRNALFKSIIDTANSAISEIERVIEEANAVFDEMTIGVVAGKIDSISINGVEQPIDENKNVDIDLSGIEEKADEAVAIAKEKDRAIVLDNYAALVSFLNKKTGEEYKNGQPFLIVTVNVPDLWVSAVYDENIPYAYTSDQAIEDELKSNGYIRVGYYALSELEGRKVDLTNYVKNTDYASSVKAGVARTSTFYGTDSSIGDGTIMVKSATRQQIDDKSGVYRPIVPSDLDYATMKALTDPKDDSWGTDDTLPALARKTLRVNDIKTIQPNENGEYVFNFWELEPGVYSFSPGAYMVCHLGVAKTQWPNSKSGSSGLLIIEQVSNVAEYKAYTYFSSNTSIPNVIWGVARSNYGTRNSLNFDFIIDRSSVQSIVATKTFTAVPLLTGAIDDDESKASYTQQMTNIGWVQEKISTVLGDIEKALDNIITIQNSLIGGESV